MVDSPTRIAIAVVEHANSFLVGQRPAGKPLAGLWEFPGGRVEAGEALEDAACRECLEETGLQVVVAGAYNTHVHDYEHDRVQLHFFACRAVDLSQSPREPFVWVSRQDLGTLTFPEGNRDILLLLCDNE